MQSDAAVLYEPADTEAFATERPVAFERIDVEEPGREEVLVEVRAASLCHTDVKIVTGALDEPYPLVLGHEGAGVVRAVGAGVTSVAPGDHVVLGRITCGRCERCRDGHANLCVERGRATERGSLRDGAVRFSREGDPRHHCHGVSSFSEYTVVNEEVAVGITDEIPLEEATLLGCGVFTGVGAVTNTADVEPGASVAVFGGGGVGLSAVQAASMAGATEVVLVDLVPEKLDLGERLGATHAVDASDGDPVEHVREVTGGGVDYAFDIVGSVTTVEQVVAALGPTGTAVVVGGPPGGPRPYELDVANMVYTEQSLAGSFNGSFDLSRAIPDLADLAVQGRLELEPMVTGVRPLGELHEAMDDIGRGPSVREVLVPGGP